MDKLKGFMRMVRKKKKAKDEREAREKDPTSTWKGASDSEKEGYKRLAAAIKKKKEAKQREKDFYKKYGK
jgi:hypothetical protein